jgi:hypothetical protein
VNDNFFGLVVLLVLVMVLVAIVIGAFKTMAAGGFGAILGAAVLAGIIKSFMTPRDR